MSLNLHQLRIFAAVLQHRGFSRAAVALRISQPAVSKSVRELETQLGTLLIDRDTTPLRPTDAGQLLLARASELFAVERSAEEELRALAGVERGVLRIAASTTIATYLLPELLARFRGRHPGVTLHVASANTRDVARALLRRRVDVALVEGPVDDARLEILAWRVDDLVVIAPAAHPLVTRRTVTLADLATESFIVRERGSGTRRVAEDALATLGVSLMVSLELGSTEAIKQAVAAGLGLAIVSRAAVADEVAVRRLAVLPIRGVRLTRDLTELRLAGRPISAAASAFHGMLRLPSPSPRPRDASR